ncbi:hypothetical protein LDO32_04085 [Luteimonas sp. Y-2-2-4F]|nr:cupin domain-containing protein [Luteimonas sp. Y-2-2-4F]MCD9030912.1 hypothetical protein [Luteimonas sp. Y-2-2-4F]
MSDPRYAEETALDWDRFVRTWWDRGPVVFRGLGEPAYPPDAVLRAVARARPTPEEREQRVRFVLDGRQLTQLQPWLPGPGDADFDAYARRVRQRAGAPCDYALIVNTLHRHGYGVWDAGRRFFHGLWERVGVPGSGAISTLFHGNYERTPVGVHKDRFATFLFVLQGRKRMRFWSQRPWTEAVATRVDYAQYLDASFAIDMAPGDVLYWPSDYYHVGETAGDGHATSVNVGIPRHEHRLAYDLDGMMSLLPPATAPDGGSAAASMFAAPGDGLPPAMAAALDDVRSQLRADRLRSGMLALHLQLLTGAGFAPPPPLASTPMPADGDGLRLRDARFPIAWVRDDGGALCGACGHVRRVEDPGDALAGLLRRLNAGDTVAAGEARDAWPQAGPLLQWLLSARALTVVP